MPAPAGLAIPIRHATLGGMSTPEKTTSSASPGTAPATEIKTRPVAMIGSYVPRRCGIATFTHDLSTGIATTIFKQPLRECTRVGVVAINDPDGRYTYGPEVVHEMREHSREDYRAAADFLNHSKFEVVSVQHEYGIFGGKDGDYLLALLERLTKPVVATLHTILAEPDPGKLEVLAKLCQRSSVVVVMAERAKRMLRDIYHVPDQKIRLIHHGVPDVPFGDTGPFKTRFEVAGRPTILTFGLLSPNKGVEVMLDALARVVPEHQNVAYIVLGATHPSVKRESGESYRMALEKRAVKLGIQDNVIFHNRYVSLEDLCEYLRATDIYVTPYRSMQQIVSGTLAYAAACGTAVVSTPYWYAQEILADGRGRLVPRDDVQALADNLTELLDNDDLRLKLRKKAYAFGRQMTWRRVAMEYATVFEEAFSEGVAEVAGPRAVKKPVLRLSLPEVRLDHLYRMTDDTGLLQHAVHATPDRRYGYSIDDVARGLIVTAMRYSLFKDEEVLKPFHTYLSYIHYARTDSGRFRNFMSYDRRWIDSNGSDDCQGRTFWALGYIVCHAPDELSQQLCDTLFQQSASLFETIEFIRPAAFAILGCHYYLRHDSEAVNVKNMMRRLTDRIVQRFEKNASPDWQWFENQITYENGRIPQALILAGLQFNDEALLERGRGILDWLLKVQTGEHGQISLIGNAGWLQRGKEKPTVDQQAVEIAALVGACKAAYRATGDRRYLSEMRRCFDWFLGSNDIGRPLVDFKSRGCYDGLLPNGVNANQGAESLVSWLLSLLIMHEMQTGDSAAG